MKELERCQIEMKARVQESVGSIVSQIADYYQQKEECENNILDIA